MAILIGAAFLQIGTDQQSMVKRKPVLFFCVINQVRGVAASCMRRRTCKQTRPLSASTATIVPECEVDRSLGPILGLWRTSFC